MPRKKVLEGGRREEMVSSALKLFFEHGYENTSVRMILDEVGGEVGMFYHHFKSKQEIFNFAVESFLKEYSLSFEKALKSCANPADIFDVMQRFLKEHLSIYQEKIQKNFHASVHIALNEMAMETIVPPVASLISELKQSGAISPSVSCSDRELAAYILYGARAILHEKPLLDLSDDELNAKWRRIKEVTRFILNPQTANHYEFDGEKYKKASKHQKEWGNVLISDLVLAGNKTILDLGCGDGVLTEKLAALVPDGRVIGIDASQGMIDTAKKLESKNLAFIRMDMNDMDFENRFDVIFSNAALHWVKNHKELLRNSHRALKNNGIIKWSFGGEGNCSNFNDMVKTVMQEDEYWDYFSDFEWPWFMPSKGEYEVLVAEAGFRNIEIELENADRYFGNATEMMRWIDQPCIVPFLDRVPDSKKQGFRQKLIDIMTARTMQPDGRCFETFRRLRVKAEK